MKRRVRSRASRLRTSRALKAAWAQTSRAEKTRRSQLMNAAQWGGLSSIQRKSKVHGRWLKDLTARRKALKKLSKSLKKNWALKTPEERAAKVQLLLKAQWEGRSLEDRKTFIRNVIEKRDTLAYRRKLSRATRNTWKQYSLQERADRVENQRALEKRRDPKHHETYSRIMKTWWDSLSVEDRAAFVRRRHKAQYVKPNRLEVKVQQALDKWFPGEWKYNSGETVIGGKIPDFVNVNSKKAVIEVFGNYWHKSKDVRIRKAHFRRFGMDCVVVWERAFKKDPEVLRMEVVGCLGD